MNLFSQTTCHRWMLVDDNADVLAMLAALAQIFTGAVVETYTSPQAALAAYAAAPETYELVITDFEMPGIDGVELCRRLHAVCAVQKVFLTTGSGYFDEAAALNCGFDALLRKPFPLVDFSEALMSAGITNGALACA